MHPTRQKKHLEEPEDHALGTSRGGWGTKTHLLTDGNGVPLALALSGAQAHDSKFFDVLMAGPRLQGKTGRPRTRPDKLVADKAYSATRIRRELRRRGIGIVIPTKSNERGRRFDQQTYEERGKIEQRNGWLKEWRAVATRYDKYAFVFRAVVVLACVIQMLKFRFSNTA